MHTHHSLKSYLKGQHHILSDRANAMVWLALIVLTAFTVALAYLNLGRWHIVAALAVATAKSTLVLLYFMHLQYAGKAILAMVFTAIYILAVSIAFMFFDVSYR